MATFEAEVYLVQTIIDIATLNIPYAFCYGESPGSNFEYCSCKCLIRDSVRAPHMVENVFTVYEAGSDDLIRYHSIVLFGTMQFLF